MRIIATVTIDSQGLVEEQEYVSTNEQTKAIFVELGWAKQFDDTKPLPPKGINVYEPGKSYPKARQVITLGRIYKSKVVTSTTWVLLEWDILVAGV